MITHRFLAPFYMLVGILLVLVLPLGDSARATGNTRAATNRGLGPSTTFTYQGELEMDGARVSGTYDFLFSLWDAASGGSEAGSPISHEDVSVTDGRFTVLLDFGDVFDGNNRYLEIAVRPGDSSGGYTALSPRQALTAAPYASHAGTVPWAGVQDVPDGFADGMDDADDAVEWAEMSGIVGTGGEQVAAGDHLHDERYVQDDTGQVDDADVAVGGLSPDRVAGTAWTGANDGSGSGLDADLLDGLDANAFAEAVHAHDERYYTEAELNTSGAGGQVHWDNVTTVPPGLADGNDGVEYANVIVVAKSGGDFTSIQGALNSIGDATADNPYLVWVAPGVYTEQVTLVPHVTVQGAGEGATVVRRTGGTEDPLSGPGSATLIGADNATVRHLTVESDATGTNQYAAAIWNNNASPTIAHVTATASGGSNESYGVYNEASSPTMTNVTATASGSSDSENFGVLNLSSSSPVMTNVTATTSGGTNNYGVRNSQSSVPFPSPMMTNVTATASGGTNNYGVSNYNSSPVMTNVTATATGGSDGNYGVHNENDIPYYSSPVIRDSRLHGDDFSVYQPTVMAFAQIRVANSQLVGDVSTGVRCYNNYTANLNPVTCP